MPFNQEYIINKFITKIQHGNFDLTYFKRNLGKLNIKENNLLTFLNQSTALYFVNSHKIIISQYAQELDIYHELFHALNCTLSNKNNPKLGTGFEEGYTEILTYRYFKSNLEDYIGDSPYVPLIYLVKYLEKIIGKNKMELYYSKNYTSCLIEDLRTYLNSKEIKDLFKDLNFIAYFIDNIVFKNLVNIKINKIRDLLIYMAREKWLKAYQKGEISEKVYLLKIKHFIKSLTKDLKHLDNYQLLKK